MSERCLAKDGQYGRGERGKEKGLRHAKKNVRTFRDTESERVRREKESSQNIDYQNNKIQKQ